MKYPDVYIIYVGVHKCPGHNYNSELEEPSRVPICNWQASMWLFSSGSDLWAELNLESI